MNPGPELIAVISVLRDAPSLDRASVERATGARLAADSESGAFAFFAGRAQVQGAALTLDWREPKPDGGAIAGPLLNVAITGACLTQAEVKRRFGPLTLTDVPHGHSTDERMQLSRSEPWGRLSFGFAEREPDCLAAVTFARELSAG